MEPRERDLIYDWNVVDMAFSGPHKPIELDDETLRDGLQSPSVTSPPIEKKLEILHLMNDLGIHAVDIGLPGAGPHVQEQVLRLAEDQHFLLLLEQRQHFAVLLEFLAQALDEILEQVGHGLERRWAAPRVAAT